jgi:hypothetical protein
MNKFIQKSKILRIALVNVGYKSKQRKIKISLKECKCSNLRKKNLRIQNWRETDKK